MSVTAEELKARFPDVRIEAIRCLRREVWSERVIPAIQEAIKVEPVRDIKSRFERLLGIKTPENDYWRKQQYINPARQGPYPPWGMQIY